MVLRKRISLKTNRRRKSTAQRVKLNKRKKNSTNQPVVDNEEMHVRKLKIIREQESMDFKIPSVCPMVSIIILNKDGANYLSKLFHAILKYNEYPNYEIIVMDNNSKDGSVRIIENFSKVLPIKIIKNRNNVSFSKGNNMAARQAKGEYLLLLNNDVEPLKGWLSEMVKCMLDHQDVGSVGSKLVYSNQKGNSNQLKIQHIGISFTWERGGVIAYEMGKGMPPFHKSASVIAERAAVTAASLLVHKDLYFKVGGLDEGYIYGYEDVDFGLKILSLGLKNLYCPTSMLFHHGSATRKINKIRKTRNNVKRLRKRWSLWLKKRNMLDKNRFVGRRTPLVD